MRPLPVLALTAALLAGPVTATPARAQVIDVSAVRCGEFIASSDENVGAIMMWLAGYFAGRAQEAKIDFARMKEAGERLGRLCGENPSATLLNAAGTVMGKE